MSNAKLENGNVNVGHNNAEIHEPEHLRKLFVGGLDYRTTDDGLKSHFEKWGQIVNVVVMKDPKTKRSRGFGFITYSQSYMVDNAQNARPHKIDGRTVEPKRAVPRQDIDSLNAGVTVRKLFVGGLRDVHDEECLREYFKDFGNILAINIVSDKETGKKRGFAFVEFDDYDPIDKIILQKNHSIKNKMIDVKKAIAKQDMDRLGHSSRAGGRSGYGNNQGVGGSGWRNNRQNGGNWDIGGYGGGWNSQPSPWNYQGIIDWNARFNGSSIGNTGLASGGNGGGNFGNDYQQSYGGGPQRSNFGNNRSSPYNPGGFNKGLIFGSGVSQVFSNNYSTGGAPSGGNISGAIRRN